MAEAKKTTTKKSNFAKASLDKLVAKKPVTKSNSASISAKATMDKKASLDKPVAKKPTAKLAGGFASQKASRDRFAVIKTGGKQYVVYAGQKYDFEKLSAEEGKDITFDQVLLVANGSDVKIGDPIVSGTKVTGKVISQFKDKKVTVLKYKPKKRYRKTTGHRQQMTKVEITKIG